MKINNKTWFVIGVIVLLLVFIKPDVKEFKKEAGGADVTRSLSRSMVYTGDTVTVSLAVDVTPGAGVKSILLHEVAPFDVIGISPASNIYESALLDQIEVSSTTKNYQFAPSSSGTHSFSGLYTVGTVAVPDGADQSIAGPTSITVVDCTATTEICDNADNDCDYSTDETLQQSTSNQNGECSGDTETCSAGSWYADGGNYNPIAEDVVGTCDGLDNNCDGQTDETQNSLADVSCNSLVDWTEINDYVVVWLNGAASWTEINDAVAAWISS